jgi:GDPmannose 4,6-dehydratase
VQTSFDRPEYTAEINALGTLRLLEAIRTLGLEKKTKFFQASTGELFGNSLETPQNENTPFNPLNPYAVSKLYAYWICVNYREAYDMFVCNGILFNHESPIRPDNFVTRKVTKAAVKIKERLQEKLYLGNLTAKRDWGFAGDYAEAMWLMLQKENPDDYVIATGETHSVKDLVEFAFREVGIEIEWEGKGLDEKGRNASTGEILIEVDPQFYRPIESSLFVGDFSKAREKLGWVPQTNFYELVKMMVKNDLEFAKY